MKSAGKLNNSSIWLTGPERCPSMTSAFFCPLIDWSEPNLSLPTLTDDIHTVIERKLNPRRLLGRQASEPRGRQWRKESFSVFTGCERVTRFVMDILWFPVSIHHPSNHKKKKKNPRSYSIPRTCDFTPWIQPNGNSEPFNTLEAEINICVYLTVVHEAIDNQRLCVFPRCRAALPHILHGKNTLLGHLNCLYTDILWWIFLFICETARVSVQRPFRAAVYQCAKTGVYKETAVLYSGY